MLVGETEFKSSNGIYTESSKVDKELLASSSIPDAIHTPGITPQQYQQLLKLLDKEENDREHCSQLRI